MASLSFALFRYDPAAPFDRVLTQPYGQDFSAMQENIMRGPHNLIVVEKGPRVSGDTLKQCLYRAAAAIEIGFA